MTAPIADPVDRHWVCLPALIGALWTIPVVVAVRWLRG